MEVGELQNVLDGAPELPDRLRCVARPARPVHVDQVLRVQPCGRPEHRVALTHVQALRRASCLVHERLAACRRQRVAHLPCEVRVAPARVDDRVRRNGYDVAFPDLQVEKKCNSGIPSNFGSNVHKTNKLLSF